MSEPKHGVAAEVAERLKGEVVGTPAAENPGAGAQPGLPLLDEPEAGGDAEAATPLGAKVRRGPGRPPGSANRLTKDIRKLILAKHCHPLLALAEIYSMDAKELAKHLECKPIDALNTQIRAAAELAPYLAAKQAAVDDSGNVALPVLQLNFGGPAPAALAASDGRGAISILDVQKLMEDQRLSESEPGASHGDGSHDPAQGVDAEGESDD
ncbi:hypothetical protein GGQ86_000378 [Xanthobacter flavus]|uniref:Uncharacterized protein n=1 Tax=Xanthobacter flavus TaxID=281 RepID=A0A9W6FMQ6_XANFL|nr:hypothetical protein [Xanthobacter flavus]MDR6331931.1 hypothetical protein [Xanthobacter flavus]GLI25635.1 hypothetical protein XFLAVUS301_53090 [Xanthobacter flavus]